MYHINRTTDKSGNIFWKNSQGQFHRTDGPAIENVDGYKVWYKNGKRHRTDGPAIEFSCGHKEWWVDDVKYSEDQFNNLSFMSENSYGGKSWYQNGKLHRTDGPAIEWPNGDKSWWVNGKLHRTDGPAVEGVDGSESWYQNGEFHRTDGPAIEFSSGYKAWYQNGKRHRTDGPAIEWSNGGKEWRVNGKLHRTDGPAIEWPDGGKSWYKDGKCHRTDGPAVERSNGKKYWFIKGVKYTEEEFNNMQLNKSTETPEDYVPKLYIVMFKEVPDMNAGKGMAQAAHAANQFVYDVKEYESPQRIKKVEEWERGEGFGTTIVLYGEYDKFECVNDPHSNVIMGYVNDETYPVKNYHGDMFTMDIQTCGYVFGFDEKAQEQISNELRVNGFVLHP